MFTLQDLSSAVVLRNQLYLHYSDHRALSNVARNSTLLRTIERNCKDIEGPCRFDARMYFMHYFPQSCNYLILAQFEDSVTCLTMARMIYPFILMGNLEVCSHMFATIDHSKFNLALVAECVWLNSTRSILLWWLQHLESCSTPEETEIQKRRTGVEGFLKLSWPYVFSATGDSQSFVFELLSERCGGPAYFLQVLREAQTRVDNIAEAVAYALVAKCWRSNNLYIAEWLKRNGVAPSPFAALVAANSCSSGSILCICISNGSFVSAINACLANRCLEPIQMLLRWTLVNGNVDALSSMADSLERYPTVGSLFHVAHSTLTSHRSTSYIWSLNLPCELEFISTLAERLGGSHRFVELLLSTHHIFGAGRGGYMSVEESKLLHNRFELEFPDFDMNVARLRILAIESGWNSIREWTEELLIRAGKGILLK